MSEQKIGYIFPGQGAQYVGMGKDLVEQFAAAKSVFDKANEALEFDLAKLCFEGPIEELTKSAVCQPAILTLSIAVLEVLKKEFPESAPVICAGLSLGEYSALVACGSLKFEDAVKLVNKRGQFMDESSAINPGTMSCLLGVETDKAMQICEQAGAEIANLNCPGQIVISGAKDSIDKANELAKAAGAKRVIPLEVSGPFHCSLMSPAAEKLKAELAQIQINKPAVPFICNVTADYIEDPDKIRDLLIQQVAHTTRWHDSILKMKEAGTDTFFEIGPGKVLRGLMTRIDRGIKVINLEKVPDFESLKQNVEEKA